MMDAQSFLKDAVDTLRDWWPGAAGSLTAVGFFLKERAPKLILTFVGGCLASRFLGGAAAQLMNATESVAGFVVGALSMVLLGTLFDFVRAINTRQIADDLWGLVLKLLRVRK